MLFASILNCFLVHAGIHVATRKLLLATRSRSLCDPGTLGIISRRRLGSIEERVAQIVLIYSTSVQVACLDVSFADEDRLECVVKTFATGVGPGVWCDSDS